LSRFGDSKVGRACHCGIAFIQNDSRGMLMDWRVLEETCEILKTQPTHTSLLFRVYVFW
jgi:hypothetical protein